METKRQLGVSSYDVIVGGKGFRNPRFDIVTLGYMYIQVPS